MDGSGWLPGANMDEWHRLVSEIPEQEEIAVVTIPVALVLLSERYTVDAVHRRMAHDAESRESDIDFLIGSKYLGKTVQVVALGMDGKGYPVFCLAFAIVGDGLYHISHNDECLVAEHLPQEIDVLGGVGCAEVLTVVQNGVAALGIGFSQFALHDF